MTAIGFVFVAMFREGLWASAPGTPLADVVGVISDATTGEDGLERESAEGLHDDEEDSVPMAQSVPEEVIRFEQELQLLMNKKLSCNACKRTSEDS